jgi:hypothetical protein
MNMAVVIDDAGKKISPDAKEAGPASKRIVVAHGFWIFLLSDVVMFPALFASYAVLVRAAAGGPTGDELFNQVSVAIETACLLASSYTCGLMSLAVNSRRRAAIYFFTVVTFVLGAAFLNLEIHEFATMIARPATARRWPGPKAKRCPTWEFTRLDLVLAVALTAISFRVANTLLLWAPGVLLGLAGCEQASAVSSNTEVIQ